MFVWSRRSTDFRRFYFHSTVLHRSYFQYAAFRISYLHVVTPWPNNCHFTMVYVLITYKIQSTSHWYPNIQVWTHFFSPLQWEVFSPVIILTTVLQSVINISYVTGCYHHIYCLAGFSCDISVYFCKVYFVNKSARLSFVGMWVINDSPIATLSLLSC